MMFRAQSEFLGGLKYVLVLVLLNESLAEYFVSTRADLMKMETNLIGQSTALLLDKFVAP